MTIRWRDTARADLVRIVAYIASENPVAARRLARELVIAADSLSLFPKRGKPGRIAGTRELLTVHPYVLVYETARDGNVDILRIWHSAQDRP